LSFQIFDLPLSQNKVLTEKNKDMGVMACDRKGCSNILCDTYVSSVGYVCGSCKYEFKEWLETRNSYPSTEKEINDELKIFMATDVDSFKDSPKMSVDEFFKEK